MYVCMYVFMTATLSELRLAEWDLLTQGIGVHRRSFQQASFLHGQLTKVTLMPGVQVTLGKYLSGSHKTQTLFK